MQDGVGVTVDDGITGPLLEGLRRAPRTVAGRLWQEVERRAAEARAAAPVKTGRWRDSIQPTLMLSEDEVRAGVSVGGPSVPYARYVRFARLAPSHPSASAWQELLRKPMRASASPLAAEILGDIADGLPGGR